MLGEELRPENRVEPGGLLDGLEVLDGEDFALADLAPLVAVRQIQGRLALDRIQEQVRVGDLDPREVVEVVRLAEARVAVGGRRAL